MIIKILGTGCKNCKKLYEATAKAVKELEIEADVLKVENIKDIVNYGVMVTPALVIDEKVMVAGKVPTVTEIKELINKR
ncbi:MAG: thioredoxin family protein [Eubacteriales bacterium]|nr:thioredoxin family protein [Eubacteriales bacterium]